MIPPRVSVSRFRRAPASDILLIVRTVSETTRRSAYVGLLALAWILAGIGSASCLAQDQNFATLLAEADSVYDRWSEPFDFVDYEASLRRAIDLWEGALALLPAEDVDARVRVLNSLSQAYFELALGYLNTAAEKETAFEAGKDAALAGLNLDPAFVAAREKDGFRAALHAATGVATIFWYGNNLGQWLDHHRVTAIFGGVRDVQASFARAIELDETYDGGGPHRSMAVFLAQAYFLVGRSRKDAIVHFERSIELDPTYLENHVNYAEYYARSVGDDALFDALIAAVLEAAEDPAIVAAHPFYNKLSIDRARALSTSE
jgi:tetratricopeptide (TPR) repeat protein